MHPTFCQHASNFNKNTPGLFVLLQHGDKGCVFQRGGWPRAKPEKFERLSMHAQALNDLFEKLLQRDVPARYLLRLGQGESDLASQGDFSRVGRVNAMLARRLTLLAQVRMFDQFPILFKKENQLPFAQPQQCSVSLL